LVFSLVYSSNRYRIATVAYESTIPCILLRLAPKYKALTAFEHA
jgi:hypothetical protein